MIDEDEFRGRLQQLEQELRRIDAPVLRYMRPGLSDAEIDEIMARTSIRLPLELRLWWRWHDGADEPGPSSGLEREIGPGGWIWLPLHEAVRLNEYHVSHYTDLVATGGLDAGTLVWRQGLFPFSHRSNGWNHVIAVDTLASGHAAAPVQYVSEMGIQRGACAESVVAVMDAWRLALETGRFHIEGGSMMPKDWNERGDSRFSWLL